MKKIKLLLDRIYYHFFPKKITSFIHKLVDEEMRKTYLRVEKIKDEEAFKNTETAKKFFTRPDLCDEFQWVCENEEKSKKEHELEKVLMEIESVKGSYTFPKEINLFTIESAECVYFPVSNKMIHVLKGKYSNSSAFPFMKGDTISTNKFDLNNKWLVLNSKEDCLLIQSNGGMSKRVFVKGVHLFYKP